MKAIKELKLRLPTERKAKGHSSTLNALKYALQCVKQVRGEGLFFCLTCSDDVRFAYCNMYLYSHPD